MGTRSSQGRLTLGLVVLAVAFGMTVTGCAARDRSSDRAGPPPARQVVVVAPVLNLSGSSDLDTLKLTDIVASELLSTSAVSVIPVNLTLAALAQRGQTWVETPEDAVDLARELGADATLVTAVTEYDPYDPPVMGLVMQWYAAKRGEPAEWFDPVTASRDAGRPLNVGLSAAREPAPRFQVQRVFNAADNRVLDDVRRFAGTREGHQSPSGWRRYVRSQELYVRYSCHAIIRTMLGLNEAQRTAAAPHRMGL